MVANQQVSQPAQCPSIDDVRVAYPIAAGLWVDAGHGVWERINILLLSNSIILVAIVSDLDSDRLPWWIGGALSVLGFVLSLAWLLRIRRATIELERCLSGVTAFEDAWRARRKRRETRLSLRIKATRIDKIGAAECTAGPLMLIYFGWR